MKFAAIRGQMGVWRYYVTALTFGDISKHVSPITDEISNSESYSNLLQRSITDNVKDIKEYLLLQNERFFNAVVLAVYDGEPDWYELEVEVEDYSTYSVGVLELKGNEIIFPVDGQHRVEGIKLALINDPELAYEKVPVILIGHQNTKEGKQKTRRLFSVLNRRAKPVRENEIIALDEDDVVAVATREIAENNPLFRGKRLIDSANKSIRSDNSVAFTSILTLYECNMSIFRDLAFENGMRKSDVDKYLRYRPADQDVEKYVSNINEFWVRIIEEVEVIKDYNQLGEEEINEKNYRHNRGGNLLFRPIALTQFVNAIIEYKKRKNVDYTIAMKQLSKISMTINEKPWKNILWLEHVNRINGRVNKKLLLSMMLFLADETILSEKEKNELIIYVAATRNMELEDFEIILEDLRGYSLKNRDLFIEE